MWAHWTKKFFYRRLKWIRLSGEKDFLYLLPETLQERYVCSCHFSDRDIAVSGRARSLKRDAVPSIFNDSVVPLTENDILEYQRTLAEFTEKIVTTRNLKFCYIYNFFFLNFQVWLVALIFVQETRSKWCIFFFIR